MQSYGRNVSSIDENATNCRIHNAKERLNECGFAAACPPDNASLCSPGESACKTPQDKGQVWGITNLHSYESPLVNEHLVVEVDVAEDYVQIPRIMSK